MHLRIELDSLRYPPLELCEFLYFSSGKIQSINSYNFEIYGHLASRTPAGAVNT
jgi:hypothetical protein